MDEVSPELARHAGELRVSMSRLARRLRREDSGHALTMSQQSALSRLNVMGAATLTELAAEERVRPQSMARTLDALTAAGLVARAPHPTDRRQTVVRPTDAGRAVIAQNRMRRDACYARECAANTWYAIGALRLRQGERDAARIAFERAIARVERHALARLGLAAATSAPELDEVSSPESPSPAIDASLIAAASPFGPAPTTSAGRLTPARPAGRARAASPPRA